MTYRERREARAERLRQWAEKRKAKATATLEHDRATYRGDYAFERDQLRQVNAELVKALRELMTAMPLDVLRMQAGNAFLDTERADTANSAARAAIARATGAEERER